MLISINPKILINFKNSIKGDLIMIKYQYTNYYMNTIFNTMFPSVTYEQNMNLTNYNIKSEQYLMRSKYSTLDPKIVSSISVVASFVSYGLRIFSYYYNPNRRYVEETFIRKNHEVTVIRDMITKLFASKANFYDQERNINSTKYALNCGADIFNSLSYICNNYLENGFSNHNNYYIPYYKNAYNLNLIGYDYYGNPVYGMN